MFLNESTEMQKIEICLPDVSRPKTQIATQEAWWCSFEYIKDSCYFLDIFLEKYFPWALREELL